MELAGHPPLAPSIRRGPDPLVEAARRAMGFDVSGVNPQHLWLRTIGWLCGIPMLITQKTPVLDKRPSGRGVTPVVWASPWGESLCWRVESAVLLQQVPQPQPGARQWGAHGGEGDLPPSVRIRFRIRSHDTRGRPPPQRTPWKNFKALAQKTLTPLLQQGFGKARTEPERGFPVFPIWNWGFIRNSLCEAEVRHGIGAQPPPLPHQCLCP